MKESLYSIFRCAAAALLALCCLAGPASAAPQLAVKGVGKARVLLAGDSLMESLGPQMQPMLTEELRWSCLPIGKKSTGLCRPDFYNWPAVLEKNLQAFRPNLVVMWVGTNDNQNVHGVKTGGLLTQEWNNAYYRKMLEIWGLCRKYKAKLIFIGPPVVGDAKVDAELKQINRLMMAVCRRHGLPFLDARAIFTDRHGRYVQRVIGPDGEAVDIRTKDQVHITGAGNERVIKWLCPLMVKTLTGGQSKPAKRGRTALPRGYSASASSIRGSSGKAR